VEVLINAEVRGVRVLLQVFDMLTSICFYRDILGFEVVQTTTPRGCLDND
jgi:catechol-2,3-dioxygenase